MTNHVANLSLVNVICDISAEHKITLAEAVVHYCTQHDIEPSDVVAELDSDFVELLKENCRASDVRVARHFPTQKSNLSSLFEG